MRFERVPAQRIDAQAEFRAVAQHNGFALFSSTATTSARIMSRPVAGFALPAVNADKCLAKVCLLNALALRPTMLSLRFDKYRPAESPRPAFRVMRDIAAHGDDGDIAAFRQCAVGGN